MRHELTALKSACCFAISGKNTNFVLIRFFFPLSQSSSFYKTQRPGDIVSSKSGNPREGDSDCAVFRSIFSFRLQHSLSQRIGWSPVYLSFRQQHLLLFISKQIFQVPLWHTHLPVIFMAWILLSKIFIHVLDFVLQLLKWGEHAIHVKERHISDQIKVHLSLGILCASSQGQEPQQCSVSICCNVLAQQAATFTLFKFLTFFC